MILRKKHLYLLFFVFFLIVFIPLTTPVILSGSTDAFARFPKWAQTFENQLSLEFRTRSPTALLFYTDDGNVQGNFYVLTIVEGRLQLDFRLGDSNQDSRERPIHSIRVEQLRVDDGKWHKFIVFQAWENVKVQLDDTVVFKILPQRSFVFGSLRTNSDVFIGGVPNDVHQLGAMSSPLRRHTKRFAGTVKNLIYRLYPQGVSSPQMISSNGTRLTDDDYCAQEFSCKNEGSCYSTNDGAACDCAFTDFEGTNCNNPRPEQALSFFGNEWIGYDVTNHTAALVQNRFENVSIMFRTVHSTGLLFTAGDKTSYVQLVLERGVLIAVSKLFGTEKRIIRMFNKNTQPGRFDDDQWHKINLYRDVQLMRLTVDGQFDEVKQLSGDVEWLGNSFAYVGGTLPHRPYIPAYSQQFRGCMKHIRYEADAQLLNIIELADQGFGQSVIRIGGDLSFACDRGRLAPAPDVLSFNSVTSMVALPKWNSPSSGSIGFQFRTGESDALLLYHGQKKQHNATHGDYIAFELIDGHLFLVLNLGSGAVRLQATAIRVNDSRVWHSVTLERLGRGGTVVVDHLRTDFSTPGVSANLDIEDPIFIGGMPFGIFETAPTVWSAHLKKGFIGCLRNVRINGIKAQISKLYVEQFTNSTTKGDIVIGCPALSDSDFCAAEPCLNGATCQNGHTSFHCDCARTYFEGPRCNIEPMVFSFTRKHNNVLQIQFSTTQQSQAEDIEMKFRTEDTRAILLDGNSRKSGADQLRLSLNHGRLQLRLSLNGSQQTFDWGENLNDNQWHTVRIRRRGASLKLFVDGKWEQQYNLSEHQIDLVIDEITVAASIQTYESGSEELIDNVGFDGDLILATFNDLDLLEKPKNKLFDLTASSSKEKVSRQRLKHRKIKSSTVYFNSAKGHLSFPISKNATQNGLRFAIKFRTLVSDAIIAMLWNQKTVGMELLAIQLVRGLLRITKISGSHLLTNRIRGKRYNDLKWHNVRLFELDVYGGLRLTVENRTAEIRSDVMTPFRVAGQLFIGGLPTDVAWSSGIILTDGFRGCMSALKIGNDPIDLWSNAQNAVSVEKGCRRTEHFSFATGHPKLEHMVPDKTPVDVSLFSQVVEGVTGDNFFAASPLDCVSLKHGADCFTAIAVSDNANPDSTMIVLMTTETVTKPTTVWSSMQSTSTKTLRLASEGPHMLDEMWIDVRVQQPLKSTTTMPPSTLTSTLSSTTTKPTSALTEFIKPKPTISNIVTPVMPVRPTTPMGNFLTPIIPTLRTYATTHDFPRTQLILIASISVIVVIAIIVFLIFCCMQQHNNDVKPPPAAIAGGYTPIPSESTSREPRIYPIVSTNNNGTTTTGIANGNGTAIAMTNGNGNLSIKHRNENSLGAPLLNGVRKKSFKEWYV